ncbi:MAG: DNA alkylation repair enzyme [uncultured Sulfurovum sp.]|uniref:DNA alkylation repair enzyme n=1 Tax=uncultured Sulfurovum sp. TaxID=269237 RepID=A0A6S6S1W2_9BACT|nr:MAG: DNA alkylation repair enzyme [uncultured Sulfurovum sp.]
MAEKFSLKDELFNAKKVNQIASEIKMAYSLFEQEKFEEEVLGKFDELELKERIAHIRDMFAKYLPDDYVEATSILLKALPPELDPSKKDDDFGEFIYAPYSDFVVTFGCTEEHLDFSLEALREMTKRFSVEYAIRDFINFFPEQTFEMLKACSLSENYHERRLASEGCRPKLPWGKKLITSYLRPIALLDNLYSDKTRFVTRSVANHLNDIAKLDASLVVSTLKHWQESKKQNEKEMDFIVSHSLRTLVKDGNVEALVLLGYGANPAINVQGFKVDNLKVSVGEALEFSFEIEAKEDESLMVDYVLYFQTKAGKLTPKVHKIKKLNVNKEKLVSISKKHFFKANMTTRKLYAGEHKLALQINGKIYEEVTFNLNIT